MDRCGIDCHNYIRMGRRGVKCYSNTRFGKCVSTVIVILAEWEIWYGML